VFFASFEHLREVMGEVEVPSHELLVQSAAMDEAERGRLLERMRAPFGPPRALIGVLGGLFAEGIDLPGDALRAVIVIGPALPPPTFERKLLQAWLEERFGDGFTLASVHPGMTRVIQAAGRVVRGAEDRGVVVLVCQRFLRHTFFDRLPGAWSPDRTRHPWEHVARFFS
jgi:Rad3-related DNA helicase